jgi:hypothetical protein
MYNTILDLVKIIKDHDKAYIFNMISCEYFNPFSNWLNTCILTKFVKIHEDMQSLYHVLQSL